MPAKSASQQHLFAAALAGAHFPKAQQLRSRMSKTQLRDFAGTKTRNLPDKIRSIRTRAPRGVTRGFLKDPPTIVGRLYPSEAGGRT